MKENVSDESNEKSCFYPAEYCHKEGKVMKWECPKIYAVKHKDESIRAVSRSGGVFSALSDQVLLEGGVVYGCALTEDFVAIHIRAESAEERNRMRGSKYIQSKLGDTFKKVQEDLCFGRKVLFSGTSCQVAGLRNFLGGNYDNLLCVDIVCHGVPSRKVWKEYLHWQELKNHSSIVAVDFRNKRDFGWRAHVETIHLKNGKSVNSKVFTTLFYGHAVLRPSCYSCPYKSVMHPGDITIADYWGIEKAAPEFDDNKGVSLVLVNNEIGQKIFEQTRKHLVLKQTKLEDSMQPPLKAPFPEPENRMQFWNDFKFKSFKYIVKKYGGYGFANNAKSLIRKIGRKIKL